MLLASSSGLNLEASALVAAEDADRSARLLASADLALRTLVMASGAALLIVSSYSLRGIMASSDWILAIAALVAVSVVSMQTLQAERRASKARAKAIALRQIASAARSAETSEVTPLFAKMERLLAT